MRQPYDLCLLPRYHSSRHQSGPDSGGYDQIICFFFFFFLTYNHNYEMHLHDVDFSLIVSQHHVPLMTKPSDKSGLMR